MSCNPRVVALAAIFAFGLLNGCATIDHASSGSTGAKLTIQAATLKIIDGNPASAERVRSIANHVLTIAGGDQRVALEAVEDTVRQRVPWDRLDLAEQLVATNLIDAVRKEIATRIDKGIIDPEEQVAVQTVMRWVITAANMVHVNNVDDQNPDRPLPFAPSHRANPWHTRRART